MWKPGQLITIRGIVYRVKRDYSGNVCGQCALKTAISCSFPARRYEQYSLPRNCYLERVSPMPIMKVFYE